MVQLIKEKKGIQKVAREKVGDGRKQFLQGLFPLIFICWIIDSIC